MDFLPDILIMEIFFSLSFLILSTLFIHLYRLLWLNPERIREKLCSQGIKGPQPSFLVGNLLEIQRIQKSTAEKQDQRQLGLLDNYFPFMHPYIEQWRMQYGDIFVYSTAHRVHLCVTRPDIVKDINMHKDLDLGKPSYLTKEMGPIFGNGIFRSNGHWWSKQKKIMAPEFYVEKVKGMVGLMLESTFLYLNSWKKQIQSEGGIANIKIDDDLRHLSADVISRACFGSSYIAVKEIFTTIEALKKEITKNNFIFGIPGTSDVPTKKNREIWKLQKKVDSLILNIVKQRRKEQTSSKDLLTILLESASSNDLTPSAAMQFVVDNCKNIYFAGHDTTATAAKWTLMLLASHPEWQIRARTEVQEVCGSHEPNPDSLAKMKTITMVIQESLRLYTPSMLIAREAMADLKLGDIQVPKGTHIWIPIPTMHRDPNIWGDEANEFRPDRFKNGVSGACIIPNAYMPFGMGPRTCLGQNLAMTELKIILSVILSNFSFSLSPLYRHYPVNRMVVDPGYGVDLKMKII